MISAPAGNLHPQPTLAVMALLITAFSCHGRAEAESYPELVRRLEPVALWRLGELRGRAVKDEIQQRFGWLRGGVDLGAAGPVQQDANAAVRFDGRQGYLRVPHDKSLELDEGALAFWFRAEDLDATQGIVTKDASGYGDGGHLSVSLQRG